MTRAPADISAVPLASAAGVREVQEAIRERGFDAWLIYDFKTATRSAVRFSAWNGPPGAASRSSRRRVLRAS